MGGVAQGVGAARRPPAAELDERLAPAAHDDLPGMTRAFERLSLLRLALHSWQNLKVARLVRVLDLLEARS